MEGEMAKTIKNSTTAKTAANAAVKHTAKCPECGEEITLIGAQAVEGAELKCGECDADLYVDTVEPLGLMVLEDADTDTDDDSGEDEDDDCDDDDDDDDDDDEDDDDEESEDDEDEDEDDDSSDEDDE